MTPHVLVDADNEQVVVPNNFVEDGRIVLNIGPNAVRGPEMGNELILFNARFGGAAMDVVVPPAAVLGIYARENGRGMLFPEGDTSHNVAGPPPEDDPKPPPRSRPKLTIVK